MIFRLPDRVGVATPVVVVVAANAIKTMSNCAPCTLSREDLGIGKTRRYHRYTKKSIGLKGRSLQKEGK
ncbi:MAG TPA: hypothetical protein DEB24_02280 [Coriobacteriia bacterium]|nr:hypothetical protein [Coriobacteriia bacterium]